MFYKNLKIIQQKRHAVSIIIFNGFKWWDHIEIVTNCKDVNFQIKTRGKQFEIFSLSFYSST